MIGLLAITGVQLSIPELGYSLLPHVASILYQRKLNQRLHLLISSCCTPSQPVTPSCYAVLVPRMPSAGSSDSFLPAPLPTRLLPSLTGSHGQHGLPLAHWLPWSFLSLIHLYRCTSMEQHDGSSILGSIVHWEIDYRKIIGIYRNFDGKLLHSYFTTVSEVFLELIAPLRPFQRCFGS